MRKILFIGDLHLGKHWLGVDLLEEQRDILLTQIPAHCAAKQPDIVVVCGDIFDSIHPRKGALELWEAFLGLLARRNIELVVISGNHDNTSLIEYGSSLFPTNINIAAETKTALVKEFGDIRIVAVPFVRPTDFNVDSYMDAVCVAVRGVEEDDSKFNILVTHNQYGGLGYDDNERIANDGVCEREGFKQSFDLVVAGHIHKPEDDENFHYVGSIMPFTFAEAGPHRCLLFEIDGKKIVQHDLPLKPKYDILDVVVEELTDDIELPTDKYIRIKTQKTDHLLEQRLKKRYPLLLKIEKPKKDYVMDFQDMDFQHRTDQELIESYYEQVLGSQDREQIRKLVNRLCVS
jgi:exonuclease SbcD